MKKFCEIFFLAFTYKWAFSLQVFIPPFSPYNKGLGDQRRFAALHKTILQTLYVDLDVSRETFQKSPYNITEFRCLLVYGLYQTIYILIKFGHICSITRAF